MQTQTLPSKFKLVKSDPVTNRLTLARPSVNLEVTELLELCNRATRNAPCHSIDGCRFDSGLTLPFHPIKAQNPRNINKPFTFK